MPRNELDGLPAAEIFRLFDVLPTGLLVTDHEGMILHSNPSFQRMCATASSQLYGTHWLRVIDPRDRSLFENCGFDGTRHTDSVTIEARLVHRSMLSIWTRWTVTPMSLRSGLRVLVHSIENIEQTKALQADASATMAALSWERERARITLDSIGDAVISTDASGRISYMNPVAETLTGWKKLNAQGAAFEEVFRVIDSNTRETVENPAQRAIDTGSVVHLAANSRLLCADGGELEIEDSAAPIFDADGQPSGAVVIFRDRKFSQASATKMFHLASHDSLTGLANRTAFNDHFEQAIKLARRHRGKLAVMFIDLDHFKQVNDTCGHTAGDRLLVKVASQLNHCVRETDTVCRYGGDEFVVLLSEIEDVKDATRIARKIQRAIRECLAEEETEGVDLSIGISLFPAHGTQADLLLRRADAAMYAAKVRSGERICLYQPVQPRTGTRRHREKAFSERRVE